MPLPDGWPGRLWVGWETSWFSLYAHLNRLSCTYSFILMDKGTVAALHGMQPRLRALPAFAAAGVSGVSWRQPDCETSEASSEGLPLC